MAIYFIQAFLITLVGSTSRVNSSQAAKRRFMFFSFGLLILVAALRSPNIGTDLASHYARRYEQIASYSWSQISSYSAYTSYEIGYCYFCKILSLINPNVQFYIAVTSFIIYGTLGLFIYRNSVDVRMSTYLLIFTCTYYNYMNIIRQALATAIVLLGYEILKGSDKKLRRYLLFAAIVVLASTIHSAAILCLTFILFDVMKFRRRDIMITVLIGILFYLFYQNASAFIMQIFGLTSEYSGYFTKDVESVGHFNAQSLYMFMTVFIGFILGCYYLVFRKRNSIGYSEDYYDEESLSSITKNDGILLYASLFASICRVLVFRMNIINRFSYLFIAFVFLIYPRAIMEIKNLQSRRQMKMLIYLIMVVYFVWMTVFYEASFHQTVPYEFFWQM